MQVVGLTKSNHFVFYKILRKYKEIKIKEIYNKY